ncbi:MAG: hypothetical protein M0Z55_06075 [Peptococcaceae bacterium]|nr:hypothetical protein [Peptococcaceae bacterium]
MGKLGKILGLAIILLLCSGATALADNVGPHGNYTANTAACAQCHRTHTANAPNLLAFTTSGNQNYIYRTCIFCHDGTGSKYDEVDGQILESNGDRYPTPAGGFQNMATIGGPPGVAATAPVTSSHIVDSPDGSGVNIPGGSQAANGAIELTCVNCHDPHGDTGNSRLLVPVVPVLSPDGTTWETISTTSSTLYTPTSTSVTINVTDTTTGESVTYNSAISNFCGACHTDYLQTTTGPTGVYTTGLYRHPVAENGYNLAASGATGYNGTNFALPTASGNVTCLTCHYAHGTTVMVATSTYDPPAPVRPATLLRMDERGVCENCHNLSPSTVAPVPESSPDSYLVVNSQQNVTYAILTFSTYMNSVQAQKVSNYALSGQSGLSVVSASLEPNGLMGKQVLLQINGTATLPLTITATNLKDLNGNALAAGANSFTLSP